MKAALTDFFDRTWVPTRPRHHVILTIIAALLYALG